MMGNGEWMENGDVGGMQHAASLAAPWQTVHESAAGSPSMVRACAHCLWHWACWGRSLRVSQQRI